MLDGRREMLSVQSVWGGDIPARLDECVRSSTVEWLVAAKPLVLLLDIDSASIVLWLRSFGRE